jgi:CheY-like chemotaxis protein
MTNDSRLSGSTAVGTRATAPRVLIVDDDEALARTFVRALEGADCDVRWARDGADAERALETVAFDVIVSDISMPGMNGIELLQAIRQRDLDVPWSSSPASPDWIPR